jgi:glutamate-1-semialdehyde 2,1-aminomutase
MPVMTSRFMGEPLEWAARRAPDGGTLRERAHRHIPGGAHTYAKGDDQFPEQAPGFIARGAGCHVWDADGNEYVEYGMGLRAVTLGHAFGPVIDAVARQLPLGSNFTRPSPIEVQCAEELLELLPDSYMVKFCKDGSMAVDGAIRLARAHTGREKVAICGDHPFFSTNDWFIATTDMPGGIPAGARTQTVKFRYNDLPGVEALFREHPGQIACVVMEAARTEEPHPGFLEGIRDCAHRHGAVLIIDEMITGFRWHLRGAQGAYGFSADLCTFGKGLGNGFSVSALAGRRELMQLGGSDHGHERVFLLSTTHGAETHSLAAAIATMRFYKRHPVIETLYARGEQLRRGFMSAVGDNRLTGFVDLASRDCCLLFATRDAEGRPSQPFRTLFMQEMIKRGILAPSFVVSYSHDEADIDRTIDAAAEALRIYRMALDGGPERFLQGRPIKPVFRRYA